MAELEVGRLGLGTANLGNLFHAITDDEARLVLETAWDCGIRYFDTAPHYGLGLAERRLGSFLATKPRDDFVVSTKVGRLLRPVAPGALRSDDANDFAVASDLARVWDFRPDGIRRSLEESLDRLGLDAVDIAYLHDPERHDLHRGLDEALPALAGLRSERIVRAIGVGSMSTDALLASARTAVPDLLMVAGRLTLVDQTATDLLPLCDEHDIGLVGAAVFNSGLLADAEPSQRSLFDYEPVPVDVLIRTRRIAAVCARFGVPLATAALQYPLRLPAVRSVVTGGAAPEQIRRNTEGIDAEIPDALWASLLDEGLVEM